MPTKNSFQKPTGSSPDASTIAKLTRPPTAINATENRNSNVIFAKASRFVAGAGWFLAEGLLTVLLSLFLLFHQAFTLLSLPYIFGMWLLFSGISKFVSSFDLRALGIRGWGWCTAIGALLALAGFLAFLDPVSDLIAISVLVGLLLVFQGIVSLLRALFSHMLWR